MLGLDQPKLLFSKTFNRQQFSRLFVDPLLMVLVLYAVAIYHEGELTPDYIVLSILTFAISFPGAWIIQNNIWLEIKTVLSQWCTVAGLLLIFGYVTRYVLDFPSEVLMDWFVITPIALLLAHWILGQYFLSHFYLESARKTAIIVGCNPLGQQLSNKLRANPSHAVHIQGFFDDDYPRLDAPYIGRISEVADYVKQHAIDLIYIALPAGPESKTHVLLDHLKDTTASIYFVPDFFMTDLIQARIDDIDGMPVVAVCETPFSGVNRFLKRVSDIVIASLILLLVLPLMVLIAIGVKWSSPGPIIFKQKRYGLDGKEIMVYKFRSMAVTEEGGDVVQAKQDDQRVTTLGHFLRRTSLDELPQFFNVLQGSMSVVGPRPHAVKHNEMYRKVIKGYMVRHKVKPGITGWAQINGFRGETSTVDSMKQRIDYDLDYLKRWSLGLDMHIIFKTIFRIFKDPNAY
jgi:putative colanic acid biosysnthesis UDP-glucose lipid carrier transferase